MTPAVRGWAAAAVAAVMLVSAACQRPMPDEDRDTGLEPESLALRVQGCWELQPGTDGEAADTTRRWLADRVLPGTIGLDTTRTEREGSDSVYRASSYRGSREERSPFSAWRPVGADSIRVETPGALAGAMLRLAVGEDLLEGTAIVFTDVVRPGEDRGTRRAPVQARPQDCPG